MILQTVLIPLGAAAALIVGSGSASAWCVVGVQRGDVLQIRSSPSPFAKSTAAMAPTACGVRIVGPCTGSWCPVAYQGRSGWSNSYFLLSETTPAGARLAADRGGPGRSAGARKTERAPQRLAAASASRPAAPEPEPPPAPLRERPIDPPRPVPTAVPAPKEPSPERAPTTTSQREVCVRGVPKGDTLKVRASPSANAELRYGFLPETCGIKLTAECKDGWCPVEYRGYKGWAEDKNLQ